MNSSTDQFSRSFVNSLNSEELIHLYYDETETEKGENCLKCKKCCRFITLRKSAKQHILTHVTYYENPISKFFDEDPQSGKVKCKRRGHAVEYHYALKHFQSCYGCVDLDQLSLDQFDVSTEPSYEEGKAPSLHSDYKNIETISKKLKSEEDISRTEMSSQPEFDFPVPSNLKEIEVRQSSEVRVDGLKELEALSAKSKRDITIRLESEFQDKDHWRRVIREGSKSSQEDSLDFFKITFENFELSMKMLSEKTDKIEKKLSKTIETVSEVKKGLNEVIERINEINKVQNQILKYFQASQGR